MILKDYYFSIEGIPKKPTIMIDEECQTLDREAIASIHQYLSKNVYFNVAGENRKYELWKILYDLYEKNTTSNKVFLMKKLYNVKIKEGA